MTNLEIAKKYMDSRYPNKTYSMRDGNDCVWVSMGLVEMYLIIKNQMVVDVQVD